MIPVELLTAVQVLVMSEEELEEWSDCGFISLGEDFLDEDSLPRVVSFFFKLAEVCQRRYKCPREAASEDTASVGSSAATAADPVMLAEAAAFVDVLKKEEIKLMRGLRMAALSLQCPEESDEDGEEEDGEEEDGEEEDGENAIAGSGHKDKKRKT